MGKAQNISVAMSVYKNDVPEYLLVALDSVINQTLKPREIVVVGDGPLPEAVTQAIHTAAQRAEAAGVELVFLPQQQNRGLGWALRTACENCRYDYIARMDSDDIALPSRFEKQMQVFEAYPETDIVGGNITEFVGEVDNIVDERRVPLSNKDIYKMMQRRCGVNHVTVIIKRESLMKAGNYSGTYRQEDYYLWARMMKHHMNFANIPDIVVNVRSGVEQFARRGGLKYFRDHSRVFIYMYREGIIGWPVLLENYVLRFSQVALPKGLRTFIYQNILRNKRKK